MHPKYHILPISSRGNHRTKFLLQILMIITMSWVGNSPAQNLLRAPESVVYDSEHHRYLASNYGTGHIVAIDSLGLQSYFVLNQYCRNGLHIAGNTVYAACIDQGVKGFNLDDGSLVAQINIDGMINLNDLASDTSGNLYVSDVYGSKIYRINASDYTYSTFVDCGNTPPNGLYFDARHNRLLVATFTFLSPIMEINLQDSSMTEIINTGFNYLDGLTQDNCGNFYFSTWQTTSVYRYDSLFSSDPELVFHDANGPADIFFNRELNVLAIPVMNSNSVVFINTSTAIDNSSRAGVPANIMPSYCYPNPFNPIITIRYNLYRASNVTLVILDILGRKIETLAEGMMPAGEHSVIWDAKEQPSGIYFYRIKAGDVTETRKMILMK